MSSAPPIELVRIGTPEVDDAVVAHIARGLHALLGCDVREGPHLPFPAAAATLKEALPSGLLLDHLIAKLPDEDSWHLGITGADLCANHRQWVFGEATIGGFWALVGTARFGAPGKPSPALLRRALTESLHEVGHLAGLDHCLDPQCVMAPSATVRDVDQKKSEFCEGCAARFRERKDP